MVHQEQEQVQVDQVVVLLAPVLVEQVQLALVQVALVQALALDRVLAQAPAVQELVQDLVLAAEPLQVELPVDLVLEQQPLRDNKKPKSLYKKACTFSVQAFFFLLNRNSLIAVCYILKFWILTAFKIASKATPTSAITASHSVARPPAPKISTNTFTPMARQIFCQTILRVM